MYGFDFDTIRKIYVLPSPCYQFLKENDIIEWNYFFDIFTYPEK